jgi:hypothetical protein
MHGLLSVPFTSLTSENRDGVPEVNKLKTEIAQTVLACSELTDEALGIFTLPEEIREVLPTQAVYDPIGSMWHGQRDRGHASPPPLPLKIFVVGFGHSDGKTWPGIEGPPGRDNRDFA